MEARIYKTGGDPIGVNAEPVSDAAVELLLEAGGVLAASLDVMTTMGQVARLTVPRLADVCVIDLLDDDGSIRDVAVAAADERIARELEELRRRNRLDPDGTHPVARVIRSGEPVLLPEMSGPLLESFAAGSEHARFMIDNDYRSAAVAPLRARERTLGAISALRLGGGRPYGNEDMNLVSELARRAALAIDNARLYSRLRSVEQRLEAVLASLAEAITVIDEHGRTVFANQAAADLLGVATPAELMGAAPGTVMSRFQVLDEQGRELALESMPARRLFAGEDPQPLLVRNIVRATGEERWLVVRASPITDPDSGQIVYAVNVFENITEVKRTQLNEAFMAEASRVLASSMDYAETLRRVARLVVPRLADWCAVDILNERGEIELVTVHHADPVKLAMAERLDRRYRPTLDDPTGVAEVLRTGQARVFTDIQPEALTAYAHDAEHLQLLRTIDPQSVLIAPMIGTTRTIGTITLISSESPRRFTDADLALSERLARRSGIAIERARIYTESSRIAHILERSLLPETLPEIPGVEIQARYSPAGEMNEVGGDFYDLFACQPNRWMLVIGDVCGKGPRAAGVTALARHTLRAAALSDQSPSEMLHTLHRALRLQPAGADLCTVCLVQMIPAPARAELTVALAGHQPPLSIHPDGTVVPLGEPGTLLGVLDPIDILECDATLRAGQTLLLYTDGVPEAGRAGAQLGEQGLRGLCAQTAHLPLEDVLEHIEHAVLERALGRLRDDFALLAVRLSHGVATAEGAATARTSSQSL